MLNKIKLLLGITDASKDSLLTLLINLATEWACIYINNSEGVAENAIIDLVVYKYNRLGTEGLSGENYSGVSFDYSEIPEHIIKVLNKQRKIGVIRD